MWEAWTDENGKYMHAFIMGGNHNYKLLDKCV